MRNNFQSRSQQIRTTLSGNRKNKLTYNKLPVSYEKIEQYKLQLIRNSKTPTKSTRIDPIFRNTLRNINEKTNTHNKFNQTQATSLNFAKRPSHRVTSSDSKFRQTSRNEFSKLQNESIMDRRPSTQFKLHRDSKSYAKINDYSPLQVIRTKMTTDNKSDITNLNNDEQNTRFHFVRKICVSQLSRRNLSTPNLNISQQFLKRGSSFDRQLIVNILKSKFREKIISCPANYSNQRNNTLLHSAIRKKIPNQFKDVIGPQQMLKMSKILTGIGLKSVNMNEKIQKAINKSKIKSKIKTIESLADDHQTLKSIKRW